MNIGFFTDSYFPQVNGVTYTLRAWKQKLQERGHKVHIYYPSGQYTPAEGETPIPAVDFPAYQGYRMAIPLNVPKNAKSLDIVHEHGLYGMAILGLMASKKHKLPKILTFHTPGDQYTQYLPLSSVFGGAYTRAYMLWERWLLNRFDHVTTASEIVRQRLLENGIKDVDVLSNGIDLDIFRQVDCSEFKKENGIGDEKVIGFCGRLGYEKHVEDLINAADKFDGTVLIAGGGPAEEHYKSMARGKKNVKFLDFMDREKLIRFYSALDAFVFPSFCETQGLVALESMACGTPVVAVPVLALKNTVEDGITGYHYTPKDTNDLLEKVERCISEKKSLQKNCFTEAERNSVEKTVDRLEKIYTGML